MKNVCKESKLIAQLFFPSMSAFSRLAYQGHTIPPGLTPQQIKVIMELSMTGDLRLSELSKCACVTHGTMTVAVQKLLKKGLLIRKKDAEDERAIRLGLSAKGRAIAKQTQENTIQLFDFICAKLSSKERQELLKTYRFLLKTYQNILQQKGN